MKVLFLADHSCLNDVCSLSRLGIVYICVCIYKYIYINQGGIQHVQTPPPPPPHQILKVPLFLKFFFYKFVIIYFHNYKVPFLSWTPPPPPPSKKLDLPQNIYVCVWAKHNAWLGGFIFLVTFLYIFSYFGMETTNYICDGNTLMVRQDMLAFCRHLSSLFQWCTSTYVPYVAYLPMTSTVRES